ncbi:MAG: dephospho-CoA kinase [Lachnospiraceae bacterium]|nr:dephospho-CoA kinase [Lachnospiraceae bacterium]
MKVIGVTGGVGCGKTALLKEISERYNCRILLADEAAGELEKKGQPCYDPLVGLLGAEILGPDGEIDPKKMAAVIFKDESLREKVNGIVHPAVRSRILSGIEEEKRKGKADYFFLEAALLIECGYLSVVDEMWYVYADADVRKKRLKKGRGYSDEKIRSIMESQLSDEEYRKNSHFTIDNSGSLEDSMRQIEAHLK